MALERKISPLKRTAIALGLGLTTLVTACGNDESKEPQKRDLLGEAADFYKETYEGMKRDTGRDSSYQEPENPAERFYGVYDVHEQLGIDDLGRSEKGLEEMRELSRGNTLRLKEAGGYYRLYIDKDGFVFKKFYGSTRQEGPKTFASFNTREPEMINEHSAVMEIESGNNDRSRVYDGRGVKICDRIEIREGRNGIYEFNIWGNKDLPLARYLATKRD